MRFPQPGELFQQKYQLIDQLGRGGFAAVYRATDIEIGREVAIKMLLPHDEGYDPNHAARFLREAKVVAQLNDPHTITMFDFGKTVDGLLYMVFEYVAGEDLSSKLATHKRLPAPVAIHVLRQLLEALREAHVMGVLHRDLKPANVLIYEYQDDPWQVKLLDFGIAKPGIGKGEDVHATLTQAGVVVGTPRYMSPEQLTGDPLTPASDIFSLGLLAYEMLVGAPAINGKDTRENLRLQLMDTPLRFPPGADVPEGLRAIVEQMIARKVDGRMKTAEQVLAALADPSRFSSSGALPSSVTPRPATAPMPRVPTRPPGTMRMPPADEGTGANRGLIVGIAIGVALGIAGTAALMLSREHDASVAPAATQLKRENPLLAVAAPEEEPAQPDEPAEPSPLAAPTPDAGAASADADSGGACGEAAQPGIHRHTDTFSGRTWTAYVPNNDAGNVPRRVVLLLHDRTRSGVRMLHDTRIMPLADEHNLLVIAPDGATYMRPWSVPDLSFVLSVLEDVSEVYCVDSRYRYGIGHNLGGTAMEELICKVPMSAIATTASRGSDMLACKTRPTPYIHLVGSKNVYLPVEGGKTCDGATVVSLEQKNKLWREHNGCQDSPKTWRTERNGTCTTYACDVPYTVCELDGGRDWPGATSRDIELPNCKVPPPDFPIAETIWAFFEENAIQMEEAP